MNNFVTKSHFKKYLTSQPFFIWNSLDTNLLEDDGIVENFWSTETIDLMPKSISAVISKTFQKFDEWLISSLMKDYDTEIITGSTEERIEKTKALLDSDKLLINPAFEYKGAIATPFAFATGPNHIIDIKYSKRTKRSDFITAYYNFSIVEANTPVNDYMLYLPKDKEYLKGEIDLGFVNRCHAQNTGEIPGAVNSKGEVKDIPFMKVLESRNLIKDIFFPTIEAALAAIELAKETTELREDVLMDTTVFGNNYEWNELLEKLESPYAGVNGNIINKKAIANGEVPVSKVWDLYESISYSSVNNQDVVDTIFNGIKESNRVIWYDFEGYSLPFAPLNYVGPHHQLVFQVSIIETVDNKETNINNFVVDPKSIDNDNLFKIIEVVYQDGADAYVVYNKAYENTRIKEMVALLEKTNHPKASKAKKMYEHIIEHTYDLCDLFSITSKRKLPPILLSDQKCKYSIKNIEKHINTNNLPLPRKITPYSELEVQNGGMAMNLAIERALGIVGDNEWKVKADQLKQYCENDVRAMIMVYDFVDYLLEKD